MKFESQLQIVTAAGVPPFTVNQTALVINLNADLLDGQHGSYYAAASSLGNYLPLTGGTLTGTLTGTIGIFTTVRTTELTSLLGSNGPITITPDGTGHVHINSTDIRLGPNNTNATLATRGTGDLILRTNEGSAVEGFIRIYDGANGNIEITPNGTGTVVVGKLSGSTASFSGQVTSTVATGTAPLVIASTTAVANLNADLLDGQHGSYYQNASNLNAGTVPSARLSGSYGISITGNSGGVAVSDNRSTATTPQTINMGVVYDFKTNSTEGLNDGGTFFGEMTFRQYGAGTDWTGGLSHQLGFTDNGNVWQRSGSNTTWGSWKKLLDTTNFSSHALPLTGGTLTGGLTGTSASFAGLVTIDNSTPADILRLRSGGSTMWKLGVTDASGSYFNITADYGNVTIYKLNGNITTPGAFVSTVATGTAPLSVTSTTVVTNLNADYLDGQHGSYYENRDTTAVGFSGGTLTLTRAAGNLTVGLDGRYLPLTGGVLTGALTGTTAAFGGDVALNAKVSFGNRRSIFTISHGGAQDLAWKKVADITMPTGLYQAVTFKVDVLDNGGNFGWNSACLPMTYFVSCRRSGGVQDDYNDAVVYGPVANYVRVVKTATGVYELQIRQVVDWSTHLFTVEATVGSASVTYATGTLSNGSTTGTIYTATAGWTQNLAQLSVAGAATFGGAATFSAASGTYINTGGGNDAFGYNATAGLGHYIKGTGNTYIYGGGVFFDGSATRALLHAGNYNSYALPLTGGTVSGLTSFTASESINAKGIRGQFTNEYLHLFRKVGVGHPSGWGSGEANTPDYGFSSYGGARIAYGNSAASIVYGALDVQGSLTQSSQQVLHTGNYTSYAAAKDGNNATGTWPIAITGAAGSVPWSGVTGKPTTLAGYGITNALPLTGGTLTGGLVISSSGTSQLQINSPAGTQGLWVRAGYDSDGTATPIASALNVMLQSSGSSSGTLSIVCGNTKVAAISTGAFNSLVALQQSGNQVLHAGNYSGYSTFSGAVTSGYGTFASPGHIIGDAQYGFYASAGSLFYKSASTGNHIWRNIANSADTMTLDNSGNLLLSGSLRLTDTTTGISKSGGRLSIRSESTDDVANFASYGLYLPKNGQTAGLYVESPIEARGGLRMGTTAANGTITVGADIANTANRLVQRDGSGNIAVAGIRQGPDLARPLASWGASGTSTGMVIFSFPGGSGNYGMVHCVFDIYEYNSNTVSTVIVGGHNWNGQWYNTGSNVIGRCGKTVRLGFKDGKYCVVFGGAASSWEYGTIVLRKIHNGSYYTSLIDMGGAFTTSQTATESFTWVSGDLRVLRSSAAIISDDYLRGTEVYASNWFRNDYSGTGIYNSATANHFYSDGPYWNVAYSGTQGIRFRNGHNGTVLGYVYAETNGNFGLLNNNGGWAVQVSPGGGGNLNGTWTIGGNTPLTSVNYSSYALPLSGGTLTGAINGTSASFSGNVKGGRITLRDDCLEQHVDNSDSVGVFVNYFGYAAGTTRFRNFGVFNGKNQQLFYITGSTGAVAITGTLAVTGAITQAGNQVLHAGNYLGTYMAPEVAYTTATNATGYTWIRIPYASLDSFNGGQSPIEFYVTRSIYDNSSTPYGGPTAKFIIQSMEWHSGQQMATVQYGERGDSSSLGAANYITHAKVTNLAGGGYWVYLRLKTGTAAGVTYKFRKSAVGGQGINFSAIESTTDPSGAATLYYGFNLISAGTEARFYRDGNQVLDAGNVSQYALPISGGTLNGNLISGAGYQVRWSDGSAAAPGYSFYADTDTGIHRSADNTLAIVTGGAVRATFNPSGHVGVGVAPSTWAFGKAVEAGFLGNALWGSAIGQTIVTSNCYYNGGLWYYANNNSAATNYEQAAGAHYWYTAANSGASGANTVCTFGAAKMALDASGNLNVTGAITQAGNQVLHAGNYTTYTVTKTGGGASGSWGISITGSSASCTGNAATATNLSTVRTNWSTNGVISAVVGQLAWKHYGNNHTIFDASNSTAPDGSAINNTNAQVAWTGTYPTLMGWNGVNTYGVRVDSARVADSCSGSAAQLNGQAASFYQNAGNLNAGTLLAARLPAFTGGDVTSAAGTVALTLANSGVTAGTYTSVTVNSKGIVTAGSTAGGGSITLNGDVTGTGTGTITTTIANDTVTNAKLKTMAAGTIKGNNAGVATSPADLTAAQVSAMLPGVARCWVTFSENASTGAITVNAQFGISSVTRLALGVYQINFSTAFSDTHYAVSGTIGYESISAYTNGGYLALTRTAGPKTTTSCEVCASYGGTNYNARYVHVVFHR